MQTRTCIVLIVCVFAPVSFGGDFRLASYYGDHMVLQKAPERAVVWGYATVGATVEVSLSGPNVKQVNSVNVSGGVWTVTLEPVAVGGPYNLTAVERGNAVTEIVLTDVLFGDVWLCGGQSNMALTLAQVYNASEELVMASSFPDVRIFQAALEQSSVELTDLTGVEVPWSRPTPELLGGKDFTHFSAVCWLFGRYLHETVKYPIGLVESCWSGTPIEAWSSPRVLHQCGLQTSENSHLWKWRNGVLWNAMIHPLLKMTIKGVIWYQGEANTLYNQDKYSCTFPALIDDWRMAFHVSSEGQTAQDFPFGFVQLCTYKNFTQDGFPEIRWHQTANYGFVPNERMKKTFMAVAMDLPDETSPWGRYRQMHRVKAQVGIIHPRDKQDVAYRLMLGARAIAYGEKGVSFQGPFPKQTLINLTSINITFDQKITVRLSNDAFEICCSEKKNLCDASSKWFPAPMKEWGTDSVLISTTKCHVDYVAALRYAWSDWPCAFKACAIYSADGLLPAPLFIFHLGQSS